MVFGVRLMSAICLKEKKLSEPFKLTINQIRAKPLTFALTDEMIVFTVVKPHWLVDWLKQKVLSSSHSVCFIKRCVIVDRGRAVAVFTGGVLVCVYSALNETDVFLYADGLRATRWNRVSKLRIECRVHRQRWRLARFFRGGEKPTRIRSVPECLTLVIECWDVCRIAHHALVSNYS